MEKPRLPHCTILLSRVEDNPLSLPLDEAATRMPEVFYTVIEVILGHDRDFFE